MNLDEKILSEDIAELKSTKFWNVLQVARAEFLNALVAQLFSSPAGFDKPITHHECFSQIVASRQGEVNGLNKFFQFLDNLEERYKQKAGIK